MVTKHRGGHREFNWINLGIIIAMSFGSLTYGYSASIISTTLSQPSFISYFALNTRADATALISTMNGLYQVGGFLGVFSVSWFADKWGRRAAIGVSALITLLSGALLAGSVHVAMFIVFRFFSGAGAFMILSAVPIWMNEVTPPRNRGMLVDIHGAALLFGYMLAAWTGNGFFYLESPNAWRAPLGIKFNELCYIPRMLTMHQLSNVYRR
jgi:MFS family permease